MAEENSTIRKKANPGFDPREESPLQGGELNLGKTKLRVRLALDADKNSLERLRRFCSPHVDQSHQRFS